MQTITVALSDEHLAKLQEIAIQFGVSPEDLAHASIEEWLTRPEEDFRRAVAHILDKNAELYRRLA